MSLPVYSYVRVRQNAIIMCSAVKVGPRVSFSKNVMALRLSTCRELGIPVDTLTNCPGMHSRKDFFATQRIPFLL